MDLDGNSEGGFDSLAEDARAYLRDQQAEENTNATDLGINVLLRDFLINEDGVVDFVPLFSDGPIEFSIVGLGFRFHAIKVRGLDSFTNFEALQPIAPQTILNSMHLDFLDVELEVSTGSSIDPPQIITAKFHFEDINATMPLFAAFDLDKLVKIEFGHLMTLSQIFPCLMSASNGIHFPQVLMSFGNFTPPTFEGFLPDSGEALRRSIQEMYEGYAHKTIKALPVMFDTSIRAFVNTFIAEYLDRKANCTHITEKVLTNATSAARNLTLMNEDVELRPYQHDYDGYVDFRELLLHPDDSAALGGMGYGMYGDLIRSLTLPIREELLKVNPTTKLSGVNNLIAPITKIISGEEGTFFYDGDIVAPVELEAGIGSLNALITFGLSDLRIENMGTIGDPLALANPVVDNPQLLNHSIGIGISKPLRVTIRPSIKIQTTEGYSDEGRKSTLALS
jgi:hypothetical protein